ncbi:MAG: 30S ribosomal protein S8e [archaeon]
MAVVHSSMHKRKKSGGKKHPYRDKQKHELGNYPRNTRVGDKDIREHLRGYGGNYKVVLKKAATANVLMPDGTYKKAKIRTVKENPANRNYARLNIITKGAIVDTDLGLIKVTSRPGQDGTLNGVLLEKPKE